MKKKLFLFIAIIAVFACIFAFGAHAAEPDNSAQTVTLDDGTVCALWDTDGNGLVWYKTDSGYAYISATDPAVDYNNGWNGGDQLGTMKITVDGTTYDKSSFVVLNFKGGIKITSGQRVGNFINRLSKTFTSASNLEYVYMPLGTVALGGEDFKSCAKLKYINLEELTELDSIGSQSFNGCSSLFTDAVVDLTNTKITYLGSGAFGSTSAKEYRIPATIKTVDQWAFQYCKSLERVVFEGAPTTLNTNSLFRECYKLKSIEGTTAFFESQKATSFWNYMFYKCYELERIDGLLENGILTIPEGITEIGTFAFSECDKVEAVIFPSTINKIYQQGFSYMDNVKIVSFDKKDAATKAAIASGESYTAFEFNNCGHFRGCKSLIAISMPEGLLEMNNRALADCTNLTAVYMPNSVKKFSTNGGGQGPFCNSGSLYFVNESFTVNECIVNGTLDTSKLSLPEKPTVYYMPTSLSELGGHVETNASSKGGTIFQNCTSLNDVIVFGEAFTNFGATAMFHYVASESSPKTVVFTADMQSFVTPRYARYISFVFANEADKSPLDLGISCVYSNVDRGNAINKESYMYFCYDESKYAYTESTTDIRDTAAIAEYFNSVVIKTTEAKHVRNSFADLVTDPTCTVDGGRETFCFCGHSFGKTEVIPMTGHTLKKIVDTYYPLVNGAHNYYANRVNLCSCQSCTDEYEVEIKDTALFNKKGYSYSEYDASTFSYTIYVNTDAIKEYSVMYGIVVSANANGAPISLADGKIAHDNKTVVLEFQDTEIDYSIITAKLTNVSANTTLHLSAYAIEGEEISYLGHDTVSKIAETVSHEILVQKYPNSKEEEA